MPSFPELQFSLLTSHLNCCSNFLTGLPSPTYSKLQSKGTFGGWRGERLSWHLSASLPFNSFSLHKDRVSSPAGLFFVSQVLQDSIPFFPDRQPHCSSFSSYNTMCSPARRTLSKLLPLSGSLCPPHLCPTPTLDLSSSTPKKTFPGPSS